MPKVNNQIISRFVSGQCTPEEELVVVRWLTTDNSRAELEKIVDEELRSALTEKISQPRDLSHIREQILRKQNKKVTNPGMRNMSRFAVRAAASLLLLTAFVFVLHHYFSDGAVPDRANHEIVRVAKSNDKGRKSTIFLPDGSTVNLNSESQIFYPEGFALPRRVVHLKGEAFFNVAENPDKPFVVKTDGLKIRAVGTAFNVRAYEGSGKVKVALQSGKVEVHKRLSGNERRAEENNHNPSDGATHVNAYNKKTLLPGQSVEYDRYSGQLGDTEKFDPKAEYGWKEGVLYFKKAGHREVIITLERWYNVRFQTHNMPAYEWSHNGVYDNMSLDQVLRQMAFTENIDYRINGDTVRLTFKQTDMKSTRASP